MEESAKMFGFLFLVCLLNFNYLIVDDMKGQNGNEIAVLGGGCFWCTEAVFSNVKGVVLVESGYSGGTTLNPTYKDVCSGLTGHAEVVKITYDPTQITFELLLKIFFKIHDPTTLNFQGNDHGTQYRSVIFYINENQKKKAQEIIDYLNNEKVFDKKLVTELKPFTYFFKAEDYHQDYYQKNPGQGYCQFVIKPKYDKFIEVFKDYLKP